MYGVQVEGNIECEGSKLDGHSTWALDAEAASIKGSVYLRSEFQAFGGVRFFAAEVGRNIECDKANITSKNGLAFDAEGIKVHGCVYLRRGFSAVGGVRLLHAKVDNSVEFDGAKFDSQKEIAIDLQAATIGTAFIFRSGSVEGHARLLGLSVGLSSNCNGTSIRNPNATALDAQFANLGRNLLIGDGFYVEGDVVFSGSSIEGDLSLSKARFDGQQLVKIIMNGMTVKGKITTRGMRMGANTTLDLRSSRCRDLDDAVGDWPKPGNLLLDGFHMNASAILRSHPVVFFGRDLSCL